jgi:hypothetical protein
MMKYTWLLRTQKPDPATVRAGIREFIEAMKLNHCNYDERIEHALLPKR